MLSWILEALQHFAQRSSWNNCLSEEEKQKVVQTYSVTGLEVCSLHGGDFMELPEVFTQYAIPVNKENILCEEDIKNVCTFKQSD